MTPRKHHLKNDKSRLFHPTIYFLAKFVQGETHNVIITSVDLLYQRATDILYPITSSLVERFVRLRIRLDHLIRVITELNFGALIELVRHTASRLCIEPH